MQRAAALGFIGGALRALPKALKALMNFQENFPEHLPENFITFINIDYIEDFSSY